MDMGVLAKASSVIGATGFWEDSFEDTDTTNTGCLRNILYKLAARSTAENVQYHTL